MSDKKVSIIYILKDKASKGFKKLTSAVKSLKTNLFSLNTFLTGLTFGLITRAAYKAAQMFGVQEQAVKSLNTALQNNGIYTKKISKNLQEYSSDLQKITIYGDEQLIQAQALFAQFGFNEIAIKKLTKATTDLASAKKIDLRQAADLLAKSVGSSTNALSRYGITIEGLPKSTARVNSAIKSLSSLFGGQAVTEAKTFNGSIIQMKNSVGDLVEIIGKQLVPIILKTSNFIKNFSEYLKSYNFKKINNFFKTLSININLIYKNLKILYTEIYKSLSGLIKLKKTFNDIFYILNNNIKNFFRSNLNKKIKKQQKNLFESISKLKKKYYDDDFKKEKEYFEKIKKLQKNLNINKTNKIKNNDDNKINFNNDSNFDTNKEKKQEKINKEFEIDIENKNKLLLEQKNFLEKKIKNENLNIEQQKKLEKNLNIFKKKLLKENYSDNQIHADALVELTNTIGSYEIKSAEDVAKHSIEILKKSLNIQIDSIIKTGITNALSKSNYPLVAAIIAAGTVAKLAINSMRFSKGGIVPGEKYEGDKIIGRLNSGEMILNRAQQARLFNLINKNSFAKKSNDNYIYDYEKEDNFDSINNNSKEIIMLTDDGRELAKGITYIQNEMKRNGEII